MIIKKTERTQTERGFSIIELLLSITVISVVLGIAIESFWSAKGTLQSQEQVLIRQRLIQNLIQVMGMPATLRVSVENSAEGSLLRRCFFGGPCHANQIQDVTLYLPTVVKFEDGIRTSGAISGPTNSAMRYSFEGIACHPSSSSCPANEFPISVSTRFQGVCPPKYDIEAWPQWTDPSKPVYPDGLVVDRNYCWSAQYIKIIFEFSPTPGSSSQVSFQPVRGSIMVHAVAGRSSY